MIILNLRETTFRNSQTGDTLTIGCLSVIRKYLKQSNVQMLDETKISKRELIIHSEPNSYLRHLIDSIKAIQREQDK